MSVRDSDSGVGTMSSSPEPPDGIVYLKITVPEINLEKALQFHIDDLVYSVKQRMLKSCMEQLKDPLNYGLFLPPAGGRAGKFFDEERLLQEYPLPGPFGQLEFKAKRRLYKEMQDIDPKKWNQMHSKANLKMFMSAVRVNDVNRVTKWTQKGFDPNYVDKDTGEAPITVAASLPKPRDMLLALVGGGALVDYRNRLGRTAMHVAAERGNIEALRSLLDLGASTNYKDAQELTPLYICVMSNNADPNCVHLLLHDHSVIDTRDANGWTEVHQVCKLGRANILDQLLYYRADINAKNNNGNTPLHICATYNQDSCAHMLIFRGASRTILNNSSQDALQTSVIFNTPKVAEVIKTFAPKDVVEYQDTPQYNEKRRFGTMTTVRRAQNRRSLPSVSGLFPSQSDPPPVHMRSATMGATKKGLTGSMGDLSNIDNDQGSAGSLESCIPNSAMSSLIPRTVVLQRGAKGYGFVLHGVKQSLASNQRQVRVSNFTPTPELPALQYLDQVAVGSPAEKAGLKKGDFVLEINNENVVYSTHEHAVELIKASSATLKLAVVTVKKSNTPSAPAAYNDGFRTLQIKRGSKGSASFVKDGMAELDKMDQLLANYDTTNGQPEVVYATVKKPGKTAVIGTWRSQASTNTMRSSYIGDNLDSNSVEYQEIGQMESMGNRLRRAGSVPDLVDTNDPPSQRSSGPGNQTFAPGSLYARPQPPPPPLRTSAMLTRQDTVSSDPPQSPEYQEINAHSSSGGGAFGDMLKAAVAKRQNSVVAGMESSAPIVATKKFSTQQSVDAISQYMPPPPPAFATQQQQPRIVLVPAPLRAPPPQVAPVMRPPVMPAAVPPAPPPQSLKPSPPPAAASPPPPPPAAFASPPPPPQPTIKTSPVQKPASTPMPPPPPAPVVAAVAPSKGKGGPAAAPPPPPPPPPLPPSAMAPAAPVGKQQTKTKGKQSTPAVSTLKKQSTITPPKETAKQSSKAPATKAPAVAPPPPPPSGGIPPPPPPPPVSGPIIKPPSVNVAPAVNKSVVRPSQPTAPVPVPPFRPPPQQTVNEQNDGDNVDSSELSQSPGRQMDNGRTANDPHAALLAAVGRRRNVLETGESQSIDSMLSVKKQQANNNNSVTSELANVLLKKQRGSVDLLDTPTQFSGAPTPPQRPIPLKKIHSESDVLDSESGSGTIRSSVMPPPPPPRTGAFPPPPPPAMYSAGPPTIARNSVSPLDSNSIADDLPPPPSFADVHVAVPTPIDSRRQSLGNSLASRGSSAPQFNDKDVNLWSVRDVGDWIDSLRMSDVKQLFQEQQITGPQLLTLGRDDLVRMGVKQAGQRMTIEAALKRLQ